VSLGSSGATQEARTLLLAMVLCSNPGVEEVLE
jgi:hypothetical protein